MEPSELFDADAYEDELNKNIELLLESYPNLNQETINKLNPDYLAHLLKICVCYTCECCNCKCPYKR